jgi:hypothetical protein
MGSVTIGVDIGQKHDPTAIAVVEVEKRDDGYHFRVRYLEALPLGTRFHTVAARVGEIVASVRKLSGRTPTVCVDATGLGLPVLELIQRAGVPDVVPVYFTYGDRRAEKQGASGRLEISLGKAYLVCRLQALLQSDRLHLLPTMAAAQELAAELRDYEIRVDENANDRYGAFKVGTHDDLVTALGLAVQADPRLSGWDMMG